MEEPWDDNDEQLVDSSSLLIPFSPSETCQDQADPLALTRAQEVDKNCGDAALTKNPSSSSTSRKNIIKIIIPEGIKEEVTVKNEDDCCDQDQDRKKLVKYKNCASAVAAKRKREKRANESPAEREARLGRIREMKRRRLAKETAAEKEERKRKARERRARQQARETEAEKAERLRQRRERNTKRSRLRPDETEAEREERRRKGREQAKRYFSKMTPQQKADKIASKFFEWEAKKATLTPEEVEHAEFQRKMNEHMRHVAWRAKFTREEWKEKGKQYRSKRRRFADLPVEKKKVLIENYKAYLKRIPIERRRKYQKTAMENYKNKLMKTNPAKWEQIYGNMAKAKREKIARETPEERQKRLLSYKVYQAKRRAKMKLEKEGILTSEEIERRLEEVVRQVEEKDRLEREKKPVDPADYQPRENARKPKKKDKPNAEHRPSPYPLQEKSPEKECLASSLSTQAQVEKLLEVECEAAPVSCAPLDSTPEVVSFVEDEQDDHDDDEIETGSKNLSYPNGNDNRDLAITSSPTTNPSSLPAPSDNTDDVNQPVYPHPPSARYKKRVTPVEDKRKKITITRMPTSKIELRTERCLSPPLQDEDLSESPQHEVSTCVDDDPNDDHYDHQPDEIEKPFEKLDDEETTGVSRSLSLTPESPPSPEANTDNKIQLESSNFLLQGNKLTKKTICEECGVCLNKGSMKVHKLLLHNPKSSVHKCPKCEKEFTTAKNLFDHYLNFHDESKISSNCSQQQEQIMKNRVSASIEIKKESEHPYICKVCRKDFKRKAHCELHVKKVHLKKRNVCDVCGKEEKTPVNLWRHKVEKHPEINTPPPKGLIICEYCSKPMLSNFPEHLRTRHPDKYKQFVERKKEGQNKIEGASKINCPECNASIRFDSMKRHMRNVHGCGSKAFPCQHCGREFKEKYHLNEHIRLLHTLDSFDRKVAEMKLLKERKDEEGNAIHICSLCDEELLRRADFSGHLLSAHLQVFEELKKGNYDGDSTPSKCDKDSSSDPWKCVECSVERIFENEELFQSHVQTSHPNKPFYCTQLKCYKLFSSRIALRLHHEKEHPHSKFRKPLCHKDSSYRYRLRRIPCLSCNCKALFLRKGELMEHLKTLHPEFYFPCPHCKLVRYTEQKLLDTHLAKCNKNPGAQLTRPSKKTNKKQKVCAKRNTKRKPILEEIATESESGSNEEDFSHVPEPSSATRTRSSSRIDAKATTNNSKENVRLKNTPFDDKKLMNGVVVLLTRLTKIQMEYYGRSKS